MGAYWGVSYCVVKSIKRNQNVAILCDKYPSAFGNSDQDTTAMIPDFIKEGGYQFELIGNEKEALIKLKEHILSVTAREYRDAHFALSECELEIEELRLEIMKAKLKYDRDEVKRLELRLKSTRENVKFFNSEKKRVMLARRSALSVSLPSDIEHLF
ncbi:hypothetical protein [Photobacterium leiognathi]|uniref:hypothetical protein n=1 Tax=Photobacterium leiognathi TaxID=553611 RepID=UPI00298164AC|nr:hypothetical protein [Photobacterium leiognathi]